jgi:polyisoprenoid-binding protein YceI
MEVSMSAVTTDRALTTWNIDPAHTSVEFAVRHLMITTVKGRFTDVKGIVRTDDGDVRNGQAEVTINAASIDTREAQRDTHLRSADFFDVERFPTITFRSTRIDHASGDAFTLVGELTIHGVTHEVALDATAEGRGQDPWGGERAGFSATGKIKRSAFGLMWNQVLEAGGVAVSDDIKIALDVELIKA